MGPGPLHPLPTCRAGLSDSRFRTFFLCSLRSPSIFRMGGRYSSSAGGAGSRGVRDKLAGKQGPSSPKPFESRPSPPPSDYGIHPPVFLRPQDPTAALLLQAMGSIPSLLPQSWASTMHTGRAYHACPPGPGSCLGRVRCLRASPRSSGTFPAWPVFSAGARGQPALGETEKRIHHHSGLEGHQGMFKGTLE